MTYMEYPIILLQVYVMFYYVLKYKNLLRLPVVPIGVIGYVITVVGFMLAILPKDILSYLVVSFIFLYLLIVIIMATQQGCDIRFKNVFFLFYMTKIVYSEIGEVIKVRRFINILPRWRPCTFNIVNLLYANDVYKRQTKKSINVEKYGLQKWKITILNENDHVFYLHNNNAKIE